MKCVWIATLLFSSSINANALSPEEYFGESYHESVAFYKKNLVHFKQYFNAFGINSDLAISVVFPEIIRYNRFRDFAETTALELAYVTGGSTVADFSIGRFQMKPSFIENLEAEIEKSSQLKLKFAKIVTYKANCTELERRKDRVARLKQSHWQSLYLACFITIANERFKREINSNPSEQLMILSSAYNLGLTASYPDLAKVSQQKTFPYGSLSMGRFSYFDVANYFYQNQTLKTQNKPL